jgi:hypothetical protein
MYAVVIVKYPNGTKRAFYMSRSSVGSLVANYIDSAAPVKAILVRPISEAEYVRHTTSE